jgi:LmbE family N-acetylglucosaminyl deacetylase
VNPGETVVFLHAHPDDESIFTGGTIRRLADRGVRTVVVIATAGLDDTAGLSVADASLVARRADEARTACELLGVDALYLLGYADAGLDIAAEPLFRLADAPHHDAVERLAALLRAERATALVTYDEGGIYPHPDHLAVHRVGVAAAAAAGVDVVYEATVDREYLHFVETHLVGHAVRWLVGADASLVTNRAPLGVPTVMVSTMVDVGEVALVKRSAIAAHVSQLPAEHPFHALDDETFAAVYGYEWFVRRGPSGPIEELLMSDAVAITVTM